MIELPVLGRPSAEQRAAFRDAKRVLRVADQLLFVDAKPGCGRAMSFGPEPEFACDWVTLHGSEVSDATEALGWLLRLTQTHKRSTVATYLSRVFGTDVREIHG